MKNELQHSQNSSAQVLQPSKMVMKPVTGSLKHYLLRGVFLLLTVLGYWSATIDPSNAQCNTPSSGVYTGNVTISSQSQMTAFASSCSPAITKIIGNVTINGNHATDPVTDFSAFSSLTEVTGNLTIQFFTKTGNPTNLSAFAALATVGGNLIVSTSNQLTDIKLPALATVGGNLRIDYHEYLTNVEVSTSATSLNVGSFAWIYQNGASTSNDLIIKLGGAWSSAGSIGADLKLLPNKNLKEVYVYGSGQLAITNELYMVNWAAGSAFNKFYAPGIGSVGGVYFRNDLTYMTIDLNFSNVSSMSNRVHFQFVGGTINFASLTNSGEITILDNPNMTSANFNNLTKVTGNLRFNYNQNTAITSLDAIFGKLNEITGLLNVTDNTYLGQCCLIPCNLTSISGNSGPFNPALSQNPIGVTLQNNAASGNCTQKTSPTRSAFNVAKAACAVSLSSFDVDENSGPGGADDNEICNGASITLNAIASATSGTLIYTFFIDKDNSSSITGGDVTLYTGTNNSYTYNPSTSLANGDKVNVYIENTGGYCSATGTGIAITVNQNPTVAGVTSGSPTAYSCTGAPVWVSGYGISGGIPSYSYAWSVSAGPGSGTFSGSTNPSNFTGTASGNATVQLVVTDSKNCSGSASTVLNVISSAGNPVGTNTYTGNVTLMTQTQVNNFYNTAPGPNNGNKYNRIAGTLTINGSDLYDPITNLCNLTSLYGVSGTVLITGFNQAGNPQALNDLNMLTKIGCNLTITSNPQFSSIGLMNVDSTGCSLYINNNSNAGVISLPNLHVVKGDQIQVRNNTNAHTIELGNLRDSLSFIGKGGAMDVSGNGTSTASALSINLTKVRRVPSTLTFNDNDNTGVTNFDNIFSGLVRAGNLTIKNNNYLSKCCIAASAVVPGTRSISGNTGNCANITAVVADCGALNKRSTSMAKDNGSVMTIRETVFNLYPNPSNGHFGISILTPESATVKITVTDMLGRQVYAVSQFINGSTTIPVNLTTFTHGQYVVKAEINDEWYIRRIEVTQ